MPLTTTFGYASLAGVRERNEDFVGMVTPNEPELANDLGRLANSSELPNLDAAQRKPGDPSGAIQLEEAIHLALQREDLAEAWRLVGLRLQG